MNDELNIFARAWQDIGGPGGPVALDDTPVCPLARTAAMPEGHAYPSGALSFRLTGLELDGLGAIQEDRSAIERRPGDGPGRVRLLLRFDRVTLLGRCVVEARPDPVVPIDTAGDLMELPEDKLRPSVASSTDGALATEEWLEQARGQRTKLRETPNGQKLLAIHEQHNAVFDEVFRESSTLQKAWKAGGATRAMAADTAQALKDDTVVNSDGKLYDTGNDKVTYNSNAFTQQLLVMTATLMKDPRFPREGRPKDGPYFEAAQATLSFRKGVGSKTGNEKDVVKELKPSEVFTTINDPKGGLPDVPEDEMMAVFAVAAGADPAAKGADAGWLGVDEEDRRKMRDLHDATMKERAERAALPVTILFEGGCRALLLDVGAVVDLDVEAGSTYGALDAAIELPAFDLDIDDATWAGETGQLARERVGQMNFLRSMIRDAITLRLRRAIGEAAQRAWAPPGQSD